MYNDPILNEAFWEAFEDELIKEAAFGGFAVTKGLANLKKLVATKPQVAAAIGNKVQQASMGLNNAMGSMMTNPAMTAAMSGGSMGQLGLGLGAQVGLQGLGKLSQGMPTVSNAFSTLGNAAGAIF